MIPGAGLKENSYDAIITDGIIYFAIVGLTFGAIETFLYAFSAGELGIGVALLRLSFGLFFHAALTAIVGYVLSRAHIRGKGIGLVFLALVFATLLHTVYNAALSLEAENGLWMFVAGAVALLSNIAMFLLFYWAAKQDIKLGLAGPQFARSNKQPPVAQTLPQATSE